MSPHLDRGLEMPAEERRSWLDRLRATDPALAEDLESLLDERHLASREGFMEDLPVAAPPASLAGQTFGAYTLISLIGQGGMGSVWLARRSDGRYEGEAAVKLLNSSLLGRSGEERFRREGDILARLAEPHIARLLDAGVAPSGQPYLVLEYVEGETIDYYCDAHGLPVEARLRLYLDVLEAVGHAHANLIVHRDIKPSNVLVDKEGRVKLLDFGIAKLLEGEGEAGAATALTRDGGRALTPEFAAPEQITGTAVTTATDVYALGILLYLLLTGRHPGNAVRSSPAELVRSILETEPERPSAVVADPLRRTLRGDLDTIVAKALKKNPAERYPSVTALAEDLRRYLRREPIRARPDTWGYRVGKFVRRNRIPVAASVLVAAAAAAGTAVIIARGREAQRQRDAAQAQLARATAANEFLGFLLSVVAPSGQKLTVSELLEKGEGLADKQFAKNPTLRSEVLATIGERYIDSERWDRALRVLDRASRVAVDPAARARALCPLALARKATGDAQGAHATMTEALRILPDGPEHTLQRAACLCRFSEFGYFDVEAEPMIRNALASIEALDRAQVPSDPQRIMAKLSLAHGYYLAGELTKADRTYAEVMADLERTGRNETIVAVNALSNWGDVLFESDIARAEPLYRRAVELRRTIEGPDIAPRNLFSLAEVLSELARYEEARPLFEETIRNARTVSDRRIERAARLSLADLCSATGDLERAAAEITEAEAVLVHNPQIVIPPSAGHLSYSRGLLALSRGNVIAAREFFTDSLKRYGNRRDSNRVLAELGLSRAELTLGQPREAEAAARRALEIAASLVMKGAPSYLEGQAQARLGEAQLAQGDRAAARSTLAAAAETLRTTLGADHPSTRRARKLAEFAATP